MDDSRRGFTALLRDLARDGSDLLRSEARLARLELSDVAGRVARGSALVALGAVLLLLGGLSAIAALVLLAGDQWLPRDAYWVAALGAVVVAGGVAGWLAVRGRAALQPSELLPVQTFETLKEDGEWLKHRRTSGRTSS